MKKLVPLLVIGVVLLFVGFWLLNDPRGLAEIVKSGGGEGWALVSALFEGIISFVKALF